MMDKVTEAIINKLPRLISQRPLEWARTKPDHPAIVEDKVNWSYRDLAIAVEKLNTYSPSMASDPVTEFWSSTKMVARLSRCCSRAVNWVPVSLVSTPVSQLLKSMTFRSIVNRVVRFTR